MTKILVYTNILIFLCKKTLCVYAFTKNIYMVHTKKNEQDTLKSKIIAYKL